MKRMKMEPDELSADDDLINFNALLHESSDLEVENNYSMDDNPNEDGIFTQRMDIREPLSKLRLLLEEKVGFDLSDYSFWLQDRQEVKLCFFFKF